MIFKNHSIPKPRTGVTHPSNRDVLDDLMKIIPFLGYDHSPNDNYRNKLIETVQGFLAAYGWSYMNVACVITIIAVFHSELYYNQKLLFAFWRYYEDIRCNCVSNKTEALCNYCLKTYAIDDYPEIMEAFLLADHRGFSPTFIHALKMTLGCVREIHSVIGYLDCEYD